MNPHCYVSNEQCWTRRKDCWCTHAYSSRERRGRFRCLQANPFFQSICCKNPNFPNFCRACIQRRQLHRARGHVPPSHFYTWLGTAGTVSRRTANKKLTKLYWPSRKRSPKLLIVLLEPKELRETTQKNFRRGDRCSHFRAGMCR